MNLIKISTSYFKPTMSMERSLGLYSADYIEKSVSYVENLLKPYLKSL